MKILKLLFLLLICSFYQAKSQQWINKNENLDYVQRHECSFVQSGDRFIMFGGREQAKRLDIYDYNNNTWSQGSQAPLEFNHFQATQYDGLIWVIGAFQTNNFPNEVPADNVYIYNPALNMWFEGPTIPQSRRRGGAGLAVYQDKFYVVAGNKVGHNGGFVPLFDRYDPLMNTWDQLADAPRARDHFSAVIIDNKLYAASGRLSGGTGGVFAPLVQQVDVYDFNSNSWSTLNSQGNIPTPRAGASVVAFENELIVIGGEGAQAGPAFKKVEAYNPSTNSWSTKENLNFARHGTQAIVSGPGIHIAGGSPNRGGGRQHNMEVYNMDSPIGSPIVASTLTALESVAFQPNESKDIEFTSGNGNAGNFIIKVELTGADASSFVLQNNLEKHLIKSGTSQNVSVLANTSSTGKVANLVVTYDNNKKVTVAISTGTAPPITQGPFGGTAMAIPGILEFEDYDIGGQGIAYNDTGSGNNGGAYRTDDVDIQTSSEGGFNVGWIATGEWLEYTVNVASAGTYNTAIRYASLNTVGAIRLEFDNVNKSGTINLPVTGGWQAYQTINSSVNLVAGEQIIRVFVEKNGINLNNITFASSKPNVSVTGVDVSPSTVSLTAIGATQTLTATITPTNATNKTVSWSSSNTAVATVNASGVVTGVASGSATITATTEDGGITDTSVITVSISTGGNNRIQNPGFETGDLTSWRGFSTREIVSTDTHSGSFAVKVTGLAGNSQIINVQPNTEYVLSAQIKTQSASKGILGVKNYGGTEKGVHITSANYTSASVTFTTGSTNTTAQIYLFVPKNGDVAFGDDFSVVTGRANTNLTDGLLAHKLKKDINLMVYPNPVKDFINLQGISEKDISVSLNDITGRSVRIRSKYNQENKTLDLSDLGSGTYYLIFRNGSNKKKKALRFVKL